MQIFLLFCVLIVAAPLIVFASPIILYFVPFIVVGLAINCIAEAIRHHSKTVGH